VESSRTVAELLKRGADPQYRQPGLAGTLLMIAVREGFGKIAEILSAHPSIEVDKVNWRGETAMHSAVTAERCGMGRLLLSHSAAAEIGDYSKTTPHGIAASRRLEEIALALMAAGAAAVDREYHFESLLALVIRWGNPRLMKEIEATHPVELFGAWLALDQPPSPGRSV
jgi:hypothetical protein